MRTCAVQCCADLDCRIFTQPRLSFGMVLLFSVPDTLSALHSMGSRRLHGALWRCFLAQIKPLISGIRLSAALRLLQAPGCSKYDARGANSQGSQHGLQARFLGAFLACFGAASSPSSSS